MIKKFRKTSLTPFFLPAFIVLCNCTISALGLMQDSRGMNHTLQSTTLPPKNPTNPIKTASIFDSALLCAAFVMGVSAIAALTRTFSRQETPRIPYWVPFSYSSAFPPLIADQHASKEKSYAIMHVAPLVYIKNEVPSETDDKGYGTPTVV